VETRPNFVEVTPPRWSEDGISLKAMGLMRGPRDLRLNTEIMSINGT